MINQICQFVKNKMFAAIVAAFCLSESVNAQAGFDADLNNDNSVNVSDVSYLIGLIMGKATDTAVEQGLCPNAMHPHDIDLGLPSGIKWSCCNLGAKTPIDYGDYFAWGETIKKDDDTAGTYFFRVTQDDYKYLGDDIAGTIFDAATVIWGNEYRMPSVTQFQELSDNCTWQWTTIDGVEGSLGVAENGGKIFLPAGSNYGGSIWFDGGGLFWTSVQSPDYITNAEYFGVSFRCEAPLLSVGYISDRVVPFSIRPIKP